ncbi:MAG: GNAT family N-acetyltransferase [Bacteroidota bacterium]
MIFPGKKPQGKRWADCVFGSMQVSPQITINQTQFRTTERIRVSPVVTAGHLRRFAQFPYQLYGHHPYWVPPILQQEINTLDLMRNPAFDRAEVQMWMAWRGKRMVGRIAGILLSQEKFGQRGKEARFGWFDVEDDAEAARALLRELTDWARINGVSVLKGPYGFTGLDKAGLLVEGFREKGTASTLYNYPYYEKLLLDNGFSTEEEWVEYEIMVPDQVPDKINRMAQLVQERNGFTSVSLNNRSSIRRHAKAVFKLILDCYTELPGFVRLSERQQSFYLKRYQRFLQPGYLSLVLDRDQQPAGFGIVMPSLTNALQQIQGRSGWRELMVLREALQQNDRAELGLIGVRPDLRGKGVTALVFQPILAHMIQQGIRRVESNPELISNQAVQNLWNQFSLRQHKRRRTYIRSLR